MTRLAAHQLPAARFHDALRAAGLDEWPDADLLDRFAHYGEHESFEALLRRHGPMVFGVCRRVLGNAADAEDAFQAVFLVFVRKARSLRRADRLGPWLYGVAVRVAMKARARRARLSRGRTEATDMIPDPSSPAEVPDWLPILDAELQALPAKYREPLVLCELQGASRAAAAKALGIPEGTLSSRLSRGRELLRRRLLKHGTLLPAGGLATLFTAGGIGRASVPVALLVKTSEIASVMATGVALAGSVPGGAARLTDEVLKGMLITKLRVACGAVLAASLIAVGVIAAWPGEAPGQPEKPMASRQTARVEARPEKAGPTGPALADRAALQGLWVLEKADFGKDLPPEEKRAAEVMVGKLSFLVSGDVWWEILSEGGSVYPLTARIDSAKNPKWIDLNELAPGSYPGGRCIYDLVGDKLRICISEGPKAQRPAEFVAEDRMSVMEFRREKMPPVAGDKALVGSWSSSFSEQIGASEYDAKRPCTQRVEILDGYLFIFSTAKGRGNDWIGGKYTVDTTKNPKWVDVELAAPVDGGKITKLYGCYEVVEGQLRLALGTSGKRVTRPLELMNADDVLFLDVKATKEPFVPVEKVAHQPSPKVRDLPKTVTTPPIATAPASTPALPRPKVENRWETNPLPKLPASTPAEPDEAEPIAKLMKAGKFAEAENLLRERLAQSAGLRAAEYRLQLGTCLVERAALGGPDADSLRARAAGNFAQALKELDAAEKAGEGGQRAEWVRTQAQLRTLRVLQQQRKPDELLLTAESFLEKRRGTVEELIVWSFVYHAWKQKGDNLQAVTAQHAMKELFDKFKDKPDAFTAKTGEYSRDYWEKVWFAEK